MMLVRSQRNKMVDKRLVQCSMINRTSSVDGCKGRYFFWYLATTALNLWTTSACAAVQHVIYDVFIFHSSHSAFMLLIRLYSYITINLDPLKTLLRWLQLALIRRAPSLSDTVSSDHAHPFGHRPNSIHSECCHRERISLCLPMVYLWTRLLCSIETGGKVETATNFQVQTEHTISWNPDVCATIMFSKSKRFDDKGKTV